ncbi:MAG: hypothetical protein JXR31_15535, partial [Prolixibacteraceae bacterium]|nr:hypothetical protein [Prolixibacteraceae bacterium]
MTGLSINTSVVDFFILFLKKGFELLEEKSQDEVKVFINSRQNENSGFTDRGGIPDFYYSLFGT